MEIIESQPPTGQQFILRHYLRDVFARAPFTGDVWRSCASAFLQSPGIPLLMHNGTSQAPASFFLNLYSTREPTYRPDGDGQWGESELRRRLKELGEHRLTMLITTDGTRSWAIYLNEGLDEVLTYHGRALPGPKYSHQDDKDDLTNGILVRHLASQLFRTKIVKLDQSEGMAARIELADDSGHRYEVAVKGWRRMEIPPPGNEEVIAVDEIRGQSGRTWFVFEPSRSAGGRKLAVQADSASWTETA